jgi:hypothetical protein
MSIDVVSSLLVSRGLGPFVGGWQNKTKENSMSVAHPTQRLLHVLPMFNLQNSRVSWCFLVHLTRVLLASFFIFLGRGLPPVGGIFWLTCCRSTKVSKSWVYKANNYSGHGGFLALLLLWSLVLQIPSFSIGRVRVDEIEKEKPGGGETIACNDIKRYRGWEG